MQYSNDNPIRIAVIGAGNASRTFHLPNLKRLQKESIYHLEIICDLNINLAKAAQQLFDFKKSTHNAQELIHQEDIIGIYVLGSASLHYEYGYQILKAGKHLFIEKPPAPTTRHLLKLYHLANDKNLIAAVGFNRRFHRGYSLLRKLIDNTSEIVSLEAVFHKDAITSPIPYGANSWLSANSIHAVDMLCNLAGKAPAELHCFHNKVNREHPQNFSAILKWNNETHAVLCCNHTTGIRKEHYTVHLPGRCCNWEENHVHIDCEGGSQDFTFDESLENQGFYGEHVAFAEAIRKQENPIHQIRNGVIALSLVEKMEEGYNGKLDWDVLFSRGTSIADEGLDKLMNKNNPGERQASILIYNPDTLHHLLSKIHAKYNIVYPEHLEGLPEVSKAKIKAIITGRGGQAISAEVIDMLPSLKVVGVVGASVKNYNAASILERNIPIINADDSYANTVAEFCLMLALIGIRNASRSHEAMRKGARGRKKSRFKKALKFGKKMTQHKVAAPIKIFLAPTLRNTAKTDLPQDQDVEQQIRIARILKYQAKGGKYNLRNATVGIVGYGGIAKRFIELLKPFDCDIAVYSKYLTSEEANHLNVKRASLSEVLSCQIVSLHRGLSPRTRKSFGEYEIECLRPGTVLINTARGELIDTPALVRRLEKNDIFACLDVFDQEPLPPESRLRKLPNVFLTSHIAGSTDQMYEEAAEELVEKVLAFLEGEYPDTLIQSKELLNNMT